jgi:hypothetical protein
METREPDGLGRKKRNRLENTSFVSNFTDECLLAALFQKKKMSACFRPSGNHSQSLPGNSSLLSITTCICTTTIAVSTVICEGCDEEEEETTE